MTWKTPHIRYRVVKIIMVDISEEEEALIVYGQCVYFKDQLAENICHQQKV